MKNIFIINPTAGKRDISKELTGKINDCFENINEEYEIYITEYKGHAKEIATNVCKANDFCKIYSVGGDGTLNEIIEGAYSFSNNAIGIYPCGTGNDFIKNFENYNTLPEINQLINGEILECDLIKVNDKVGINVCSIGFDAEIARNVSRFKKFFSGSLAYNISLAFCFLTKTKFNLSIVIDEKDEIKGDFIFAVAANGGYYGGGYNPAPLAIVNDTVLDFVLIKAVSRLEILSLVDKYKKGTHIEREDIVEYIKGKKMKVKSRSNIYYNVDGEVFSANEVLFEIIPNKIKIIIPNK